MKELISMIVTIFNAELAFVQLFIIISNQMEMNLEFILMEDGSKIRQERSVKNSKIGILAIRPSSTGKMSIVLPSMRATISL